MVTDESKVRWVYEVYCFFGVDAVTRVSWWWAEDVDMATLMVVCVAGGSNCVELRSLVSLVALALGPRLK